MSFFDRIRKPLAAGLAALTLASPAAARVPTEAKPALWEVSDPDTKIYLFGTIHLLPENTKWRSAAFDKAVDGSQELVVETIIDDKNPMQLMSALASLAISPGLPPLRDRVPEAKRVALDAAVKKSGMPAAALDRMETWAAAFMLMGTQFKEMGLKGEEGVEAVLRSKFLGDGKKIGELETNVEQLSYFDRLPEAAQRQFLEGTLAEQGDTQKQFSAMIAAWARGDIDSIEETFNRELSSSPELEDALLTRRNANWNKWVKARLDQPGQVMVAVGAGHLVGDGSLVDLLRKDGFTVRRVQ